MNRIAIIPARGGSKRIPHKNVLSFEGKPMVAWTIQAALESGCFQKILVSTDSPEIAEVSLEYGAEVPFLRKHNVDDYSPVSEATISALHQAEAHWQSSYGEVVQLMANCPLRKATHIVDAIKHFEAGEVTYQISCFRYGWMNPWWAACLDDSGVPTRLFTGLEEKRSQDLENVYCPTGAIWIARRSGLLAANSFYGVGHRFYPIDWQAAVDIDDMDDLAMAVAVARMRITSTQ